VTGGEYTLGTRMLALTFEVTYAPQMVPFETVNVGSSC